jgi:hypothetical protein
MYLGVEGFINCTYSYANKYTPVQMGSPQSINTSYIYVQRSREEKKNSLSEKLDAETHATMANVIMRKNDKSIPAVCVVAYAFLRHDASLCASIRKCPVKYDHPMPLY